MYLFGSMAYFVLSLWISVVLSKPVADLVTDYQFYVFGHQGALYQYFYGSFPSLTLFVPVFDVFLCQVSASLFSVQALVTSGIIHVHSIYLAV